MANIYGTNGHDTLYGTMDADFIVAYDGDDTVYAGSGNDGVYGAYGSDLLRGQDGNDVLYGWYGHDYLYGDAGDDSLSGGPGKDVLSGASGADWYIFNKGDTGYYGLSPVDLVFDFISSENDKINLFGTSVTYFGGQDRSPELNEVSYWYLDGATTVVSFNDGGVVHDVVLLGLGNPTMTESDFII